VVAFFYVYKWVLMILHYLFPLRLHAKLHRMKTVSNANENFIFHCKYEKGLSSKTIKSYSSDIRQFMEFLHEKRHSKMIMDIDKNVLKDFLKFISDKKPKTIKRKVATLKAMFNFLEFEDEIEINPFRKMRIQIKEPKRLPSILNISEVQKILKTIYKTRDNIISHGLYAYKEAVRDIAVVELLFATGIRVSELCNLKLKDIGTNFSYIVVVGKGDKERVIQICNNETITALKIYLKEFIKLINKGDSLFINRLNNPLSPQSDRYMIRKFSILAGINKNITPHTFRHTFATLLLEEGVDIIYIQHLLGHSSIMTTQIYTHVNKVKQKQILRTKHPRKKFSLVG
jgi:integrase/recombinase XerD